MYLCNMSCIIISSVKIVYYLQLQKIAIISHWSRGLILCHLLAPLNRRPKYTYAKIGLNLKKHNDNKNYKICKLAYYNIYVLGWKTIIFFPTDIRQADLCNAKFIRHRNANRNNKNKIIKLNSLQNLARYIATE